jgi:N-acetylneuraminic acid mutarotase
VFELDTQLKSWSQKTDCTGDHTKGAAAVEAASGYIIGSARSSDRRKCREYDPDAWSDKTDRTDGSWWHAGSNADTNIYAFGGNDASDKQLTEEYDLATTWSTKTNIPYQTNGCSAGTVDDKIYLTGGDNDITTPGSDKCYEYDPDTWTQMTSIPFPSRGQHATAVLNDKIFITCGSDGLVSALDDTTEFDPSTNAWTTKTDHPFGGQVSMCFSDANGMGYWLEGKSAGNTKSYEYDEAENTWTDFADKNDNKAHNLMNQHGAGIQA